MYRRSAAVAFALFLTFAAAGFAGDAARPPAGTPTAHPHFNDKGTLSWSTKLADTQTAAKSAGKVIFIDYGREA